MNEQILKKKKVNLKLLFNYKQNILKFNANL